MAMPSDMFIYRQMAPEDLLKCNNVNLDYFTENFHTSFYKGYLTNWPELCVIAEAPDGVIAGYVIGKVEGTNSDWHGHVTAISVAPEFRKSHVAQKLMSILHDISNKFQCNFVDLYVRGTNKKAIQFYKSLGYTTYRIVENYYSGEEDAWDMRKTLLPNVKEVSC